MAKPNSRTVTIGEYTVTATLDEQGQLTLEVDHNDGTEVTNTALDVAKNDTQWAALLVSEGVEMDNIKLADPDEEEVRLHGG